MNPSELMITLPNGNTLRCGMVNGNYGGFVRIVDKNDQELAYWSAVNWEENPQETMRDIFGWAERWGKCLEPQEHEDPVADAMMYYGNELSQTPGHIDGQALAILSTGCWLKLARVAIEAYKKVEK